MPLRYSYTCPNCGERFEFHKRVTMRRRHCPECGYAILISEIDRQREEQIARREEEITAQLAARRKATRITLIVFGAVALAILLFCGCACLLGNLAAPPPPKAAGKR